MNFFVFSLIASFSITAIVITGLVRYSYIKNSYQPFFILSIIGLANEITSFLQMRYWHQGNAVNSNCYVFIEACFLVWQFVRWGSLTKKKAGWIISGFIIVWVTDNAALNDIHYFNSIFRIWYSFILVFLSISQLNILLLRMESLLKNTIFLLCCGFILYFSCKATVEVFYLLKLPFSPSFYINVNIIITIVNLFCNLLFAVALLWIPRKQKFILPY